MKPKYLIKILTTSIIFSSLIFVFAWKINYLQGFIFLITNVITSIMNFWTIRNDNDLMSERSKINSDAKKWDKIILSLSGVIYLISIAIAGLDSGRFHWSKELHWSIYIIGFLLTIIGQIIFLNARKENKYFSSIVRIQSERNHKVCDTGIYKIVRHPGYFGMILSLIAIPFLTASIWSFIPILISIILLIIRTYLEDKTLKNELEGYFEYSKKTKNRLIPYIW